MNGTTGRPLCLSSLASHKGIKAGKGVVGKGVAYRDWGNQKEAKKVKICPICPKIGEGTGGEGWWQVVSAVAVKQPFSPPQREGVMPAGVAWQGTNAPVKSVCGGSLLCACLLRPRKCPCLFLSQRGTRLQLQNLR